MLNGFTVPCIIGTRLPADAIVGNVDAFMEISGVMAFADEQCPVQSTDPEQSEQPPAE